MGLTATTWPRALAAFAALAVVVSCASEAGAEAQPHRSTAFLPSSNGVGAIAWDRTQFKLTQFLEHPYAQASAASAVTRNFAFDSYPGVRVGGTGTWLDAVAPVVVEYVPGTAIVHAVRKMGALQIDEYEFAPAGLAEHASVMLLEVTGPSGGSAVDAYAIFNYHLGSGGPQPGTDAENITYDATRDAYFETGPSGVAMAYASVGASTHHGCTPNNPYTRLQAGSDLADDAGTGGPTNDAVAGLQSGLGALGQNTSAWAGWVSVLAPDANGGAAVDRVRTWLAGRTAQQLLADEKAAWASWITAAPSGASTLEASLDAEAQVMLRMGQVAEPGGGAGQILASVAPGAWNIAWVRDMAYATVGLVRSGHYAEAKAALAFQMGAKVGDYQQYVGAPYGISVVRYYGDGSEQSDSNQDGPNVEFDGFGLFLWALDEYVRASGDTQSLAAWWPAVKPKVADVLVKLQEPTGLIAADSSIWEVHWNGKQRHFAYTTIAAANGLCAASRLATAAGDAAGSSAYIAAGQKSRDAVLASLRAPDETIAQSTEGLAQGTGWLDAATLEAIGFGLIDPSRRTARATMGAVEAGLVPQSGRGFMRSDTGDWYSSQEWVFVDLRAARALELRGDAPGSAALFGWNVAQASDNFGELSELHDATTADYAGQAPMVGFGAGTYLLALRDRGKPGSPTCGSYASEPADAVDGGEDAAAGGDGGSAPDAAAAADAGGDAPGAGDQPSGASSGGCGCTSADRRLDTTGALVLSLGPLALLATRARRRRR
jgi:GH15 family glucan-1,4-alpha-glucosidase